MAVNRGSDPSDPSNNADNDGRFKRQVSSFRNVIEKGGKHPPEKGRYLLYIVVGCPWAQYVVYSRIGL
jgi:glutathionyl-hydroquinone reductase